MKRWIYLAVLIYFIPMLIWWLAMVVDQGLVLSYENSDWGNFGSFVGGLLSPLFTLVGFIFIYESIRATDKNHNDQINLLKKQNRSDNLINLLKFYNEKLNESSFDSEEVVGNKAISIYTDNSKIIKIPKGTIKNIAIQFQFNKDKEKITSKEYIDYISVVISNAEYCLLKTLDFVLAIESETEREEYLDLIEAVADTQSTMAILEINNQSMRYNSNSPILDRLVKVNKKSKFYSEYAVRYENIIEYLHKQQLTNQSSRPPSAAAD